MRTRTRRNISISGVLTVFCLVASAATAQTAPKYAADVPAGLLTLDVVDTQTLGQLEFFDGMPEADTVAKVYDNLDLIRATTAFLVGMQIASLQGLLKGYEEVGGNQAKSSFTRV